MIQLDVLPFTELLSQFGAVAAFAWLAREYRITRQEHREERKQWQDSVTELTRQIHDLRHEIEALEMRSDGGFERVEQRRDPDRDDRPKP